MSNPIINKQQISKNLLKVNEHPELNNIPDELLQEAANNAIDKVLPNEELDLAKKEVKKKKKRSKDSKAKNINEQCFAVTGHSSKGRIRCLNKKIGESYCNKCTRLANICSIPGQFYTNLEKPELFNEDGSFKLKNDKNKNNSVKKLQKGLFYGDLNTQLEDTYKVKVKEYIKKEEGEDGELEEIEVYKLYMNYSKSKLNKLEGFTEQQRKQMLGDMDSILSNPIYKNFKNGPWVDNLKPAIMKHGREKFLSLDALSFKWNGGVNSSWYKKKNKLEKKNKKKKEQHEKSFKNYCKTKGILKPLNVYMRVLNKYRKELTEKVKKMKGIPSNKVNTLVAKLASEKYNEMKNSNQLGQFKKEYTEELLLYKSKFNTLKVEWANMEHNMMLNVSEPVTTFREYLKQLGIKKPLNVYMRVLKDKREEIKKSLLENNKDIPKNKVNTLITKKAGELYQKMTEEELKPYNEAYLQDKTDYQDLLKEELKKYETSLKNDENIKLEIKEKVNVENDNDKNNEKVEKVVNNDGEDVKNEDNDEDEDEEECEPIDYNGVTYYKSNSGYLYDEEGEEMGICKEGKIELW